MGTVRMDINRNRTENITSSGLVLRSGAFQYSEMRRSTEKSKQVFVVREIGVLPECQEPIKPR